MTAPQREIFVNVQPTTLDGDITSAQTTLVVADATGLPSTGNFRVQIGAEIMLCTSRTGTTLTVERGAEDTQTSSHSDTSSVIFPITAGSLETWGRDNVPLWGISPPFKKIVADDGVTLLTSSDFTWVNQESSSVSDQNGTILLRAAQTTSLDNRLLVRTAPSTPYAYVGAFHICLPRGDSSDGVFATMGFRESSTGEFEQIEVGTNLDRTPQMTVERWTNSTTFSATIRTIDMLTLIGNALWFKIEDDGTDLTYYISNDGTNWIEVESNGRTAFMAGGPDQVFWGARNDNNNTNASLVRLLHWSRVL